MIHKIDDTDAKKLADELEALLPNARLPRAMAEEPIGYDSARSFVETLRGSMWTKEDFVHACEWADWLREVI